MADGNRFRSYIISDTSSRLLPNRLIQDVTYCKLVSISAQLTSRSITTGIRYIYLVKNRLVSLETKPQLPQAHELLALGASLSERFVISTLIHLMAQHCRRHCDSGQDFQNACGYLGLVIW